MFNKIGTSIDLNGGYRRDRLTLWPDSNKTFEDYDKDSASLGRYMEYLPYVYSSKRFSLVIGVTTDH